MMSEHDGRPEDGETESRGGSPLAVYRDLARNRPFRRLMLSTFTSATGDWVGFLAIIALTSEIMGPTSAAAFAVSGVMMARVLPSLLLGPVAGVFVDRWDRKRVMIFTHVGRGTVMMLIPFTNEVLTLLLATLVIEAMSSMFAPAKDSVLPSLVNRRQLVGANQVNLLTTYGTLPLGALLFSVLMVFAEAVAPAGSFLDERTLALPIWINASTFWISAVVLLRMQAPPRPGEPTQTTRKVQPARQDGPWQQLKEGFRFVGTQPVIRAFILGVMVAAAAAGVVITAGEFFAQLLNAGQYAYGILVAIVGAGLVSGLLLSQPVTERIQPERLFAPAIGIAGASLIITAVMPSLLTVVPTALLMGAGAGVCFIVGYTVLQHRANDRIRGRTFGAFNSGIRLAIFSSAVAVPFSIGVLGREQRIDGIYPYAFGGVRLTLMGGGVLALIGAVLVGRALARALRREAADGVGLDGLDVAHAVSQPHEHTGVFVVFEGGDGTGKSTQIRLLRSAVERVGHIAVVTREPGGTALGEKIRTLLLEPSTAHELQIEPRTEALLFSAARAQHVDEVIVPALRRGNVVLCDRFVDSSVVYQGAGRGLGERPIEQLNHWVTEGLQPDLTVLLDLDPSDGLSRAVGADGPDRIESAGSSLHRKARSAYLRRAERHPDRYLVLDATRPVEEIHAKVREAVLARLPLPTAAPVEEPHSIRRGSTDA